MAEAEKLVYRIPDVRKALGISTATIYRMCDRGELTKNRIGSTRSVGITAASVHAVASKMGIELTPTGPNAENVGSQMGS